MNCRKSKVVVAVGECITQPNQAFTPRQILEQFARNEVIPSYYSPSDSIDEGSFSESQMENDIIEFEDKIDAENHLIQNQYSLVKEDKKGAKNEEDKVKSEVGESDKDAPTQS